MAGNKVRLVSISVIKLYGCYDYYVDFNPDVTFIHGLNGCGKTTILNITKAIITGQFFKLFRYGFNIVVLRYTSNPEKGVVKELVISSGHRELAVIFEKEPFTVEMGGMDRNRCQIKVTDSALASYFDRYPFLLEIKNTFNCVNLFPLPELYMHYLVDDINSGDVAVLKAETLINQTCSSANIVIDKKMAMEPLGVFLNTVNSFIGNSEDGKVLFINSKGQVCFKTKYNNKEINIQRLSSGEKQIIVLFANLIFADKEKSSGIFIVDEPELSLHLSWQKIFIDKVLEVNKDVQLVLATKAPEIIGKRRNKMFKLEKKYTGAEQN